MDRVSGLLNNGIIRKIAFLVNQRSTRYRKVALIGAKVPEKSILKAVSTINSRKVVAHNYLRNHERYNVWFTFKAETLDELYEGVEELMAKAEIRDFVVLPSKRVYKISYIKYDLENGVPRCPTRIEPVSVPTLEELGVDVSLALSLAMGIKAEKNPLGSLARRHGIGEGELLDLLHELAHKGVIRDWGAVLDGGRLGFVVNAMVVLRLPVERVVDICLEIVKRFEEVSHCVEREVAPGRWEYPAYFVTHARERKTIDLFVERVRDALRLEECLPLYSVANLRKARPIVM
ncbi:MAG: Lrp/AsnC family transcriptional regulator [Nitrososphaeria archaeon]|nr:Lrp/AsnC family transcriptional regulator [Nitrososphaeria archaeon]NIQ33237.1 Lrp/AsnC family transcriptional regulator [Nitrososphaeria archaeon]